MNFSNDISLNHNVIITKNHQYKTFIRGGGERIFVYIPYSISSKEECFFHFMVEKNMIILSKDLGGLKDINKSHCTDIFID